MSICYLKHHRPQCILVDDTLPCRWYIWLLYFIYVGSCFLCNKQKYKLNGRGISRTEWHRNIFTLMISKISSGSNAAIKESRVYIPTSTEWVKLIEMDARTLTSHLQNLWLRSSLFRSFKEMSWVISC